MNEHSFSAAASRRDVSLGGIIATPAAGLPNARAFSRRGFFRPIGGNQTSAGFCQGDAP
jgi:hypothetical protein